MQVEAVDGDVGKVDEVCDSPMGRAKDEIKNAPELDTQLLQDPAYQESVTRHYGATRSKV
jgi:hypothetical protein